MGLTALVVEDDAVMRRAIVGILRENPDVFSFSEVVEAEDGLDGLRLLKKHFFNLVLVDWMMPKMDGYNFVKTVRQNPVLYEIPIIMITSKRSLLDVRDARRVGVTDYIVKPFEKATLVAKVGEVLKSRSVSEQESEFLAKARKYYSEKNFDEAIENYSMASRIVPGRTETKMEMAEAYLTKGDASSADATLESISGSTITNPLSRGIGSLYVRIGDHYLQKKELPDAEKRYSKAIATNPNQRDAYEGLGSVELERGNAVTARKHFDSALNLDVEEGDIQNFNFLAIRHRRAGRPEEAVRVLERALQHFPNDAAMHYNLGRAYLDMHRREDAVDSFKKAKHLDPSLIEADEMLRVIMKKD